MSNERVTAAEERFLQWLNRAAMAAATLTVAAASYQLWRMHSLMGVLYGGKTHALPLGMQALIAVPAIIFAIIPFAVAAACIAVEARFPSRVVTTLFHLLVLGVGLGFLLLARDIGMAGLLTQSFGGLDSR